MHGGSELQSHKSLSPLIPVATPWRKTGVAALVDHDSALGNAHDQASRTTLLRRIAALLSQPHLDPMDAREAARTDAFLVPSEALEIHKANKAGINEASDFLGGVVPAPFVGTKAITHGLVDDDALRPEQWSNDMARLMGDAALPGYTAFSHADAAKAGRLLLAKGPVRIKDVCGKAGLGQIVVDDIVALDIVLGREDALTLATHGIVLEENLTDVVTYSVGLIELAGQTISYWGSQNLTVDHKGRGIWRVQSSCRSWRLRCAAKTGVA